MTNQPLQDRVKILLVSVQAYGSHIGNRGSVARTPGIDVQDAEKEFLTIIQDQPVTNNPQP